MFHALIILFWLSLLIGTALAHNIVANWAVALAGLYFLAQWLTRRTQAPRTTRSAALASAGPRSSDQPASAASTSSQSQTQSRWTVDRVHAAGRPWR
jgi:hypothetical protein